MSSSSGVNIEKYLIPLDEINRVTENFSRKRYIGGGGFGPVYKGQLSECWQNQIVAVKRLDADGHQGEREFRNEIELISRFHHENIIAFIGYCDEGGEMIIVYEYALNGSLDHYLQDPNKISCITWVQRLEICIGAARGLHYLHSGLGEKHIVIHRDIKSANILLDGNMVAKICDFGLSKMGTRNQPDTRLYTKVAGTQFYLDPTYLESCILQKESDVYSFGVVLFEILSGTLVYRGISIGDKRQSLINTVRRYNKNEPEKVLDPCMKHQIKWGSFDKFKEIAYQCISLSLTERPTLDNVIMQLEAALNIQISTPAEPSMIKSLIGKLNSVSTDDQRISSAEMRLYTRYCRENCDAFAEAGAIPRLTHLLTAPDSRTQEHAVTVLLNLSRYDDNKGTIISSGGVQRIAHILKIGSNVARENAADAIYNLSEIDEVIVTSGSSGVIPPLVSLLSEGTTRGKRNAADCLERILTDYDNKGMAVTAGLVPILMKLLTEPQGVLKEESITLLAKLSRHPEGMLAIGEAQVVPHLVEVIGRASSRCQADAVTVLMQLSYMDKKYLVEALEHGVMGKLMDFRQNGTQRGKGKARELRRMIKDYQHLVYGSDSEDVHVVRSTGTSNVPDGTPGSSSGIYEPDPTDWRLIAKAKRGAAQGLYHLHSGLGEHNRVIHRDVKSANILLDDNIVAKICDFGLSRWGPKNQPNTRLYTKVAGTQSYLDPTYLESGILQKEVDVYSFGVVLFEIVSGMLVYRKRSSGDEQVSNSL
ncbi:hypothetical protein LXL04_000733 [Taraxacum kok-saghyz]